MRLAAVSGPFTCLPGFASCAPIQLMPSTHPLRRGRLSCCRVECTATFGASLETASLQSALLSLVLLAVHCHQSAFLWPWMSGNCLIRYSRGGAWTATPHGKRLSEPNHSSSDPN